MRAYLVFQLYGPLASWGDIAVGETRPSTPIPSKSAISACWPRPRNSAPGHGRNPVEHGRLTRSMLNSAEGYGLGNQCRCYRTAIVRLSHSKRCQDGRRLISPAETKSSRSTDETLRHQVRGDDPLSPRIPPGLFFAACAIWSREIRPTSRASSSPSPGAMLHPISRAQVVSARVTREPPRSNRRMPGARLGIDVPV